MLIGLRRPAILLPEEEQDEIRCKEFFLHELAHLARGDVFWNFLGRISTAILFFQPLLWLLVRRLAVSAEEVCDDYVIYFGFDRPGYARRLIEIAEQYQPMPAVGAGVISLRSFVGRRIVRILDSSRQLSTCLSRRMVLSVALTSIAITCLMALLTLGANQIAAADADSPALETNEKAAETTEQKPEEYRLEAERVAIYNITGDVEVVPGSGSAVVVEVRRGEKTPSN